MDNKINAHNSILDLIGNTPLVKLNQITSPLTGNFYAKIEAFNPGHSSKDRIASYIIDEAEKNGVLEPGNTIIETTSGNTGFSIAMVSIIHHIRGYRLLIYSLLVKGAVFSGIPGLKYAGQRLIAEALLSYHLLFK